MKRARLLCLMALLCACAHKSQAPEPQPEQVYPGPTGPCSNVYTYAPANFIVDVSAGSEVELDPVVHEFPIFCTPADARQALKNGRREGKVPGGDWKIYRLKGGYDEIGRAVGPGKYVLARPTLMVDWVQD